MPQGMRHVDRALLVTMVLVSASGCGSFLPASGDEPAPSEGPAAGTATDTPGSTGSAPSSPSPSPMASGFCSGHIAATFCQDFDTAGKVDDGWTSSNIDGTGALDDLFVTSAPRALHFTLPENTTENGTYAHVDKEIARPSWPATTHLELDIYLKEPTWDSEHRNVAIGELALRAANGASVLKAYLVVSSGTVEIGLTVNGSYQSSSPSADTALPSGRWAHLALDVDAPESDTFGVRLALDGNRIIDHRAPITTSTTPTVTKALLSIGLHNINPPAPALDVHYDNVLFDQK